LQNAETQDSPRLMMTWWWWWWWDWELVAVLSWPWWDCLSV